MLLRLGALKHAGGVAVVDRRPRFVGVRDQNRNKLRLLFVHLVFFLRSLALGRRTEVGLKFCRIKNNFSQALKRSDQTAFITTSNRWDQLPNMAAAGGPTWYEDGDGGLNSSPDNVVHCKHPVRFDVMVPQDLVHLKKKTNEHELIQHACSHARVCVP